MTGATPHIANRRHRGGSAAAGSVVLARWRGLGLRGRVMLALAVIVLVLSVTVAATVFATVSGYLLGKADTGRRLAGHGQRRAAEPGADVAGCLHT